MTWTPYGPPPADMQHKTMRDITPAEAYRLAGPARRRQWFGDDLPTKAAGQYDLPPSAPPPGLPPDLEAQVKVYQATHLAPSICAGCLVQSPDGNAVNGECPHGPRRTAERLAFQQKARAMNLAQQLAAGHLGTGSVRVVDVGQAATEDATRAEWHAIIDQLFT